MKLEQSDKAIIFANTQIPDIFLAEYLTSMTGDYLKIYLIKQEYIGIIILLKKNGC